MLATIQLHHFEFCSRSVPVRPWRAEGIGHILNFELLKLWLVLASVRRTVQSAVRATLVVSLRRGCLW